MLEVISSLVEQLSYKESRCDAVISWASPVPSFGNYEAAGIATVGINPSNLEFVSATGNELVGNERRFPSLRSLGITNWREATKSDVNKLVDACEHYFHRNPYYQWFNQLDFLLTGTGHSYYNYLDTACHLDLVPFATFEKWSSLPADTRERLIIESRATLARMIEGCGARLLLLNGQQVVTEFEKITNSQLNVVAMPAWDLPRRSGRPVLGKAYLGELELRSGKTLNILGYNHNIQSSFGVTKHVKKEIRNWISTHWNRQEK